jgi:hypothetical protein
VAKSTSGETKDTFQWMQMNPCKKTSPKMQKSLLEYPKSGPKTSTVTEPFVSSNQIIKRFTC